MLMRLCDVMSPRNEPVCDVTITSSFFPLFTKKAQFCTYFLQNATSLLREVAVMEAERYKSQENRPQYLFLHRLGYYSIGGSKGEGRVPRRPQSNLFPFSCSFRKKIVQNNRLVLPPLR